MTLTYKQTNHSYFCSEVCWTESASRQEYSSWEEFINEYSNIDMDLSLLFRFDIKFAEKYPWVNDNDFEFNEYKEEIKDGMLELKLFFMQQRKGRYVPVNISSIKIENMKATNNFLRNSD